MLLRFALLLTGLLAIQACSGTAKPLSASVPAAGPSHPSQPARPEAPRDPRKLSEHATFGELVHLTGVLDDGGQGHSEAGCLVRGHNGLRLAADLAPAARPLPSPPEHVTDDISDRTGSIGVMTTWGNAPGDLRELTLLAFTTTSTNALKLPSVALFVTQAGVFLRGSQPTLRTRASALSAEEAGALLAQLEADAMVYATADREVEVQTLLTALRFVPNRFEVALAVALPRATRLPPPPADTQEGLCSGGLPAPAADETEGELSVAGAQAAVAPLRQAALDCAQQAGGHALLGGKLLLALRVGAQGRVREACFTRDEVREPVLRRCLISHARQLALPPPSPTGFADLELPLQLQLVGPTAQRASCD